MYLADTLLRADLKDRTSTFESQHYGAINVDIPKTSEK